MKRWLVVAVVVVLVCGLVGLGWRQVNRKRAAMPVAQLTFTSDTRGITDPRTLVLEGDYLLTLGECVPAAMSGPTPESAVIQIEVLVGNTVVHRVEITCPAPAQQLKVHLARTAKGPVLLQLAETSQSADGSAVLTKA